jgi:hypothetical protein
VSAVSVRRAQRGKMINPPLLGEDGIGAASTRGRWSARGMKKVQKRMVRTEEASSREASQVGMKRDREADAPYITCNPCFGGDTQCVGSRKPEEKPSIRVQEPAGTGLDPFDRAEVT